jgi:hypothetical protein
MKLIDYRLFEIVTLNELVDWRRTGLLGWIGKFFFTWKLIKIVPIYRWNHKFDCLSVHFMRYSIFIQFLVVFLSLVYLELFDRVLMTQQYVNTRWMWLLRFELLLLFFITDGGVSSAEQIFKRASRSSVLVNLAFRSRLSGAQLAAALRKLDSGLVTPFAWRDDVAPQNFINTTELLSVASVRDLANCLLPCTDQFRH